MTNILRDYTKIYNESLLPTVDNLRAFLSDILRDQERIDSISVRAKSPDRFLAKAEKTNRDGNLKYSNPLAQIQDQIGARIIVFYKSDVELVSGIVDTYFRKIEAQILEPEEINAFGYMGKHFIMHIPKETSVDGLKNSFFELQIKTLFQHAWAEASHDIAYKQLSRDLTPLEKRLIAFAAAQSWGADNAFAEIFEKL